MVNADLHIEFHGPGDRYGNYTFTLYWKSEVAFGYWIGGDIPAWLEPTVIRDPEGRPIAFRRAQVFMARAHFRVPTGQGFVEHKGWITTLPGYPEVKIVLHRNTETEWGGLWCASEYESGALLARGNTRTSALWRARENVERNGGLEGLLQTMAAIILQHGRANPPEERGGQTSSSRG
jgi:hypothetical protein